MENPGQSDSLNPAALLGASPFKLLQFNILKEIANIVRSQIRIKKNIQNNLTYLVKKLNISTLIQNQVMPSCTPMSLFLGSWYRFIFP